MKQLRIGETSGPSDAPLEQNHVTTGELQAGVEITIGVDGWLLLQKRTGEDWERVGDKHRVRAGDVVVRQRDPKGETVFGYTVVA